MSLWHFNLLGWKKLGEEEEGRGGRRAEIKVKNAYIRIYLFSKPFYYKKRKN